MRTTVVTDAEAIAVAVADLTLDQGPVLPAAAGDAAIAAAHHHVQGPVLTTATGDAATVTAPHHDHDHVQGHTLARDRAHLQETADVATVLVRAIAETTEAEVADLEAVGIVGIVGGVADAVDVVAGK